MNEKLTKREIDIMNGHNIKFIVMAELFFIVSIIISAFILNLSLTNYFLVKNKTTEGTIIIIILSAIITILFKGLFSGVRLNTIEYYDKGLSYEDIEYSISFNENILLRIFTFIAFEFVLLERIASNLSVVYLISTFIIMTLAEYFIKKIRIFKFITEMGAYNYISTIYKVILGVDKIIFNLFDRESIYYDDEEGDDYNEE